MVFDCFPFFNELDVLEIRLHELDSVVDKWIICEAGETYGGDSRHFVLGPALLAGRFKQFEHKIDYMQLPRLHPSCTDRKTGRAREAYQRNQIGTALMSWLPRQDDWVIFSDCDEIPSAVSVRAVLLERAKSPYRFLQHSFYYNVNTLTDFGNDWASRARMGRIYDISRSGSLYAFRMEKYVTPITGGWHFSYFGGPERIMTKVAAMSPFLSEYQLWGEDRLINDIEIGRDLHHRKCELPERFDIVPTSPSLPAYLLANKEKFKHFFREGM